jgi:PAS domain S-box-containing protein
MKNEPNINFPVLDLLKNILNRSEMPSELGSYITFQIHELLGPRLVILIQHIEEGAECHHQLLSVYPATNEAEIDVNKLEELAVLTHQYAKPVVVKPGEDPGKLSELFLFLGKKTSIFVPLEYGNSRAGLLLLVDMADLHPVDAVLDSLNSLSGVLALVIRNNQFYKTLESKVLNRTTELNKSLELLRRSEENFRRFLDESPFGIRIVTYSGETVYANPTILKLYGIETLEEFKNLSVSQRYTKESYQLHLERKANRQKNPELTEEYTISINRKNGEISHLAVIRKGILWNGVYQYQVIYQDITDRVLMLEKLIEAKMKAEESNRLKTAFMNNISHEIRTPLNGILGFGEIIVSEELDQKEKEQYLAVVNASSERLINTISDYMDISLLVSGNQEVYFNYFSVDAMLDEIYQTYKSKCDLANIDLILTLSNSDKGLMIKSDRELVRKVFRHLIGNALKFTKIGEIEIGMQVHSKEIEFFVRDTGAGIHPDFHKLIFDFFMQEDVSATRGHEGSGLGLAISKSIVELLGGQIKVESAKGVGSTFRFILPLEFSQSDSVENKKNGQSKGKQLILIVEDDIYNGKYVELLLKNAGYDTIIVDNGLKAVETCMQNEGIKLILMDLKMPILNGFEATKRIRIFRPDLPIIALTAYAQSSEENQAFKVGCTDYLLKPVKKEMILKKIDQYLN